MLPPLQRKAVGLFSCLKLMQHSIVILLGCYAASAPSMLTFVLAVVFFVMVFAYGGASG